MYRRMGFCSMGSSWRGWMRGCRGTSPVIGGNMSGKKHTIEIPNYVRHEIAGALADVFSHGTGVIRLMGPIDDMMIDRVPPMEWDEFGYHLAEVGRQVFREEDEAEGEKEEGVWVTRRSLEEAFINTLNSWDVFHAIAKELGL